MTPARNFEMAMSNLVAAIGDIERNKPVTQCEMTMAQEQVSRLDAIVARAFRGMKERAK